MFLLERSPFRHNMFLMKCLKLQDKSFTEDDRRTFENVLVIQEKILKLLAYKLL